jgi:hypothetical protein
MMIFHDWIHLPPLTDIKSLQKAHSVKFRLLGSLINGLVVFIPLCFTVAYAPGPYPFWVALNIFLFYFFLTIGTICSWWIPYLFGSSEAQKEGFKEYKNTHHFLPPRSNNVIPNTFHVILHIQVWICLLISIYLLLTS